MRNVVGASLALCLLALAVPELTRWAADLAAERAVRDAVTKRPGFQAGRIHSLDGASRIEIDDVAAAGPGWRLTAGRLVVPGPGLPVASLVTPAYARPANVVVENLGITLGGTRVVIPHLEARGTDLTSQSLAALLDPADPTPPAQRLARLTAAQISAPTVVMGSPTVNDPAAGDHLSLKDLSLTDVGSGRIGSLTVASLAFSTPQGGTMTVPAETGRVALEGIDLPLALDMATAARTEAASALRPLLGSLSIDGLVIRPETGATVEIAAVLAGGLKGRPLLLPPSDAATLLDKPASERTPADNQILADLVGDASGSAVLEHLEVRGAAVKALDGRGSFKLARAVLDGFELVKLGSLVLEDVAFREKATDVSLGRLVVGGYDGSGAVAVLKQQFTGGSGPLPTQVVPNRTSLTLTDLHVASPITPQGMAAVDPGQRLVLDVPMASIGAHVDTETGVITSRAAVDLAYDATAGAADPSFHDLVQYGMGKLDLSTGYTASYDPGAKEVRLDRFAVDARDLGRLSVAGLLGNVSSDTFHAGQDRDEAMQAAQAVVFRGVSLDFVNAGIVEKMLPTLAAAAKISVPLFKAQLKAQAEISLGQMLGTTPASARIISALRSFIDTPKNLSLVVKAPAGLSFSTIAAATDPKALLGALDIQVVANR